MSDTRKLVLSARIESKTPRHAHIGVFQNGAKAGVLIVDAEQAERVVGLIAVVPDMLTVCEAIVLAADQNDWALARVAGTLARAAIAKAKGEINAQDHNRSK